MAKTSGSSPLARGTRYSCICALVGNGLIPARAGNTRVLSAPCRPTRAHPRSRGEHPSGNLHTLPFSGSSPLARGTHGLRLPLDAPPGLIPARAGNTCCFLQKPSNARAHPRSRGEHDEFNVARDNVAGSSPLARGTHSRLMPSNGLTGLIPARAGNTRHGRASAQ